MKIISMQNLVIVVFIFLLALISCQEEGNIEKVFLEPDEVNWKRTRVLKQTYISTLDKTYELHIKTNSCNLCENDVPSCPWNPDLPMRWTVNFRPVSQFISAGMKICGDTKNLALERPCRGYVSVGKLEHRKDCFFRRMSFEWCQNPGKTLPVVYQVYSFCQYHGPVYITLKPAYHRLTYRCPSATKSMQSDKFMSFLSPDSKAIGNERLCPEFIIPVSGKRKFCMKFIYAAFSVNGAMLKIKGMQTYNDQWTFSHSNPPRINYQYCGRATTAVRLKLKRNPSWDDRREKHMGHSVIIEIEFDEHETTDPEEDDDGSKLSPAYIALIVIGSFCGACCCYCCVRCNHWGSDEEEADANEADSLENLDAHGSNLGQLDMDVPVVHDTIRGMLQAVNPVSTQQRSSASSNSGSPQHLLLPISGHPIADLAHNNGVGETSLEEVEPSVPPLQESSASTPPPSYESLFPVAR